jgi:hypothetical protein
MSTKDSSVIADYSDTAAWRDNELTVAIERAADVYREALANLQALADVDPPLPGMEDADPDLPAQREAKAKFHEAEGQLASLIIESLDLLETGKPWKPVTYVGSDFVCQIGPHWSSQTTIDYTQTALTFIDRRHERFVVKDAEPPTSIPPAHTALLRLGDRAFYRLRFWTNDEWPTMTAGEFQSLDAHRLKGFGYVALDQVSTRDTSYHRASIQACGATEEESLETFPLKSVRRPLAPLPPPPAPNPDEYTDEERKALAAAETARRKALVASCPAPFMVISAEYEHWRTCRRSQTLEETIQEVVEEFDLESSQDMAIWRDDRLHALVRRGTDGQVEVVRLIS